MGFFGRNKEELEKVCQVQETQFLFVKSTQNGVYSLCLPVSLQTWFIEDLYYVLNIRVNYYLFCEARTIDYKGFGEESKERYIAGTRRLGYGYFERKNLLDIVTEKTSRLYSPGEILACVACYKDLLLAQKEPYADSNENVVDIRGASSQLKRNR
ncbi:MAG: hypothetical protein Q8R18_01225 [bacterium]|nr:hypothetical protein [bacterium]